MSYNTYNVGLSCVFEFPGSLVQLLAHYNPNLKLNIALCFRSLAQFPPGKIDLLYVLKINKTKLNSFVLKQNIAGRKYSSLDGMKWVKV